MIAFLIITAAAGAVLFYLAANLVGSALAWLLGFFLPTPRQR